MQRFIWVRGWILVSVLLVACGKESGSAGSHSSPAPAAVATPTAEAERLKVENTKLQAEVATLRRQVEELGLTPQALLARVTDALAAGRPAEARATSDALEKRFADSAQARAAKSALSRYDAELAAREDQAKALEARGFYALQPQKAPTMNGVTVRVESLQLGGRWTFDVHGDEWHYRDAERGERFVLLKTTIQSTDKRPDLPDIAVYRIDGKTMSLLAQVRYEFSRWSSYGAFIGLHHDFKNDFAHTPAVAFNAAASISEEDARKPLAVVATGDLCHERGTKNGQPEVVYTPSHRCSPKAELSTDDFANRGNLANRGHHVLAFFNRPKGV